MTFTDRFGRTITYLRISLTDRCNLRCVYCMPKEGLTWQAREDQLSVDEMIQVVESLAQRGVKRVRLTGGEPLVPGRVRAGCADHDLHDRAGRGGIGRRRRMGALHRNLPRLERREPGCAWQIRYVT